MEARDRDCRPSRRFPAHASPYHGLDSDLERRLPLAAEETLYRIAQEALHNVVKHAGAKQVWLGLHERGAGVRLQIQDDGRGFDPEAVPDGHLGLAGMRSRAERVGATFECRSAEGQGTLVQVEVPGAALQALAAAAEDLAALPEPAPSIRDG